MKRSKHHNRCNDRKDNHEIVLDLVNHLDAMVAYWDAEQVCVFANNAYRYWFGKSGSDFIGLTLKDLLGPLDEKNLPYIEAAYQGQRRVFEREIPTPSGIIRHSLASFSLLVVDGKVQGIFVHVADVSSLKKLEQELKIAKERAEKLATLDFLTGLPNRVLLVDTIKHAIAVAKRRNHWVAVISLDMDDFKKTNDTYGHGGGDQLLIDVASRLKTSLRESDTVARLGGDEFLLVGAEIESNEQVETMAKRILETVAQRRRGSPAYHQHRHRPLPAPWRDAGSADRRVRPRVVLGQKARQALLCNGGWGITRRRPSRRLCFFLSVRFSSGCYVTPPSLFSCV